MLTIPYAGQVLRPCPPDEIAELLPGALDGRWIVAPLAPGHSGAHLDADDPILARAAVVVSTSGSTGAPKGVALSARALLASAAATRDRLGGPMHWVSALPHQYVAGLMTVVRALEAGTTATSCAGNLSDLARPDHPTAISMVPTQLVRALERDDLTRILAAHAAVLLGGSAAPADLVALAGQRGISVVTSYGMSETCGGCVYDGVPLTGVGVAIDQPDGARGRLSISGPVLFEGYLGDPAATAAVLRDGWFHTADRGEVVADGATSRVRVLGRIDDVVISGGVNVDLAQVQRAADAISARPTAVLGAPHPVWGTAVVLVTDPGAGDLDWWKQQLSRAGIQPAGLPKAVLVRDHLPRLSSGKIDRQGLAAEVDQLFAT